MARGGKKAAEANPEAEERKRRKKMAFSRGIISEAPAKATSAALMPSKMVAKHHGADVIRKSQRKNRFLFSFPGLIAPVSGGKIGDLKDLGTKNPILYLDFPQGQMKLFGTIVYPKNRYLTLQFSRGGKNVMCEDYFDTMIVFSDAWWIGRKEDNPEEARLELPKELHEEHKAETDFKGGAGGTSEIKQSAKKSEQKFLEQDSPGTDLEDSHSDDETKIRDLQEVTPTRHSERTAGKRFNFAEGSSGDDIVENHVDISEDEEKEVTSESPSRGSALGKDEISIPPFEIDKEDAVVRLDSSGQVRQSAMSIAKSKEISHSNRSSLVQTTISSLFKKVEEEMTPKKQMKSSSLKAAGQNLQHIDSGKRTTEDEDARPRKKGKVIDEIQAVSENMGDEQPEDSNSVDTVKIYKRKTKITTSSATVKGRASRVISSKVDVPTTSSQIDEDDIEEFSSTSKDGEDSEGSDEDWAG